MSDDHSNQIEEALTHQEKQISDLSDMVTRQWDEIDRLKKGLMKMQDKIGALEDSIDSADGDTLSVSEEAARNKPPHY